MQKKKETKKNSDTFNEINVSQTLAIFAKFIEFNLDPFGNAKCFIQRLIIFLTIFLTIFFPRLWKRLKPYQC